MLGQALPHSHAGTVVAEPDGHNSRPHVHFHSHDHGHSHGDDDHGNNKRPSPERDKSTTGGEFSPVADHDSNAIYLTPSTQLSRTCPSIAIDVFVNDWSVFPIHVVVEKQCRCRSGDPPDKHAAIPIYLLKASLLL